MRSLKTQGKEGISWIILILCSVLSNDCQSQIKDLTPLKVVQSLNENSSKVKELKESQLGKYALSMISDVESLPVLDASISHSERLGCAVEVLKLSSPKNAIYNSQKDHIITFGKHSNNFGHYLSSKDKVIFVSFLDKESTNVFGYLDFGGHRYKLARSYSNFIIASSEKDFEDSQFIDKRNGFALSQLKVVSVEINEDYLSSLDRFIISSIQNIAKGLIKFREQMATRDISSFDTLGFRHIKGILRCKSIYSKSKNSIVYKSINQALKDLKQYIYVPIK